MLDRGLVVDVEPSESGEVGGEIEVTAARANICDLETELGAEVFQRDSIDESDDEDPSGGRVRARS